MEAPVSDDGWRIGIALVIAETATSLVHTVHTIIGVAHQVASVASDHADQKRREHLLAPSVRL